MIKRPFSSEFLSMFREYDIRGETNAEQLNEESVHLIVSAYAEYLSARGIYKVVVGYDNRKCSPSFADACIKALLEQGKEVYYVGLGISPMIYYAQYLYECEGAVMITASHNPDGWSGFKFAKGYSKTLEPDDIKEVFSYVENFKGISDTAPKGTLNTVNARDAYVEEIVSRIKMGPFKPRLVIDAGNGGAGLIAYEVFFKLGCLAFQLNCDPDDNYPHYFPNPSNLAARERLREMVLHPYIKADIGLGFDGDGDRLGVIDEKGKDIYSDIILAVLSKQLLERKKGASIVYDVKCSQTLEDVVLANGGKPIMWLTGHSYIKAKLHEEKADLAGERSGHTFFSGDDYFGFDDAVFTAAKLIEYISHKNMGIGQIVAELPQYVTSPEIKAFCPDTEKYKISELVVEDFKKAYPGKVFDLNGARVSFEHGWGLVRPSSNLPEMVIIFEADTLEHLLEIRQVFKDILGKYPEISSDWENDPY
ncbi:MAG TPA: phosphomannomutase/phosphoglucomutase [Clostridiales bacterium]|jgi:phosphomannomutase|nr:phosphomannomutase/phosphoglucomutase [Clostridiales bacterium]